MDKRDCCKCCQGEMNYGQEDSSLWVMMSLEFNHLDLINSNHNRCSKIDITHFITNCDIPGTTL